jgi:hypothetical protein
MARDLPGSHQVGRLMSGEVAASPQQRRARPSTAESFASPEAAWIPGAPRRQTSPFDRKRWRVFEGCAGCLPLPSMRRLVGPTS